MLKIHFIGIGGISTSAFAKYFFKRGYYVSGSDKNRSYITEELENLGIKINYFHHPNNCKNCDLVIYNSAIDELNPELLYARYLKIPCYTRAEILNLIAKNYDAKIGISGTHGKTTVTALIAHILYASNLSFTAHIGGYDNVFGNFIDSGNKIFLSEICEFKRNINLFIADYATVLNIDNDHLNCYQDLNDLYSVFNSFLNRAKFRIINIDDKMLKNYSGDAITYGINEGDYHIENLNISGKFQKFSISEFGKSRAEIKTSLIGKYSLYNVLAGIAVARTLKISFTDIQNGINTFVGVKRRNEFLGTKNYVKYYADYAHHPSEIASFLGTFLQNTDKNTTHVVFQPHTYSRTKLLFNDFIEVLNNLDNLYLFSTYSARENYDYEGSSEKLSKNLPKSRYYENFEDLKIALTNNVAKGDTVLILGAGDIYQKFTTYLKNEV